MTITGSTGKSRGPSNEIKNVAGTEKQLESMAYRLKQENGWWPFLTQRLENATNKTREEATTPRETSLEFSGETTGAGRRKRDDGG